MATTLADYDLNTGLGLTDTYDLRRQSGRSPWREQEVSHSIRRSVWARRSLTIV